MVKIFPVKSVVPVMDVGESSRATSKLSAPNRFRSQSYDRPFGSDDCTMATGNCNCHMCCKTPLVIAAGGVPICDRFNVTLRNMQEYLDAGLLKVHQEESFIICRQLKADGSFQVGVFAAIDADDYRVGILRPHEHVTAKTDVTVLNKVKKPSQHMDPVMILYRDNPLVNDIVQRVMTETRPFQELRDQAEHSEVITHTLWEVTCPDDICALQAAFATVGTMYIADGHHRTAASYRESQRLAAGKKAVNVAQSARFLTALLFPDSHLSVLSYNRCVHRIPAGMSAVDVLAHIGESFLIEEVPLDRPSTPPVLPADLRMVDSPSSFSGRTTRASSELVECWPCTSAALPAPTRQDELLMYLAGTWYALRLRCGTECEDGAHTPHVIGCTMLLELILNPIFGMNVPGVDNHMIYVDGREGSHGVERLIAAGEAALGFVVCPLPTSEVMRVADAGQRLPAKATFFDPKPMHNILLRLMR